MKIQILAGDSKHIQLWQMIKLKNHLSDLDIKFVDKNPDMILYHTYKAPKDIQIEMNNTSLPVMILERIASARIYSRQEIEKPNVVGILKSTIYRDLELDNSKFVIEEDEYPDKTFKNNYHSKMIYDSLNIPCTYHHPGSVISKENFNKVELWYNFGSYEMMLPYVQNVEKSLNDSRPLDIGFIGTTQYGSHSDPITKHRKQCINIMKNIQCQKEIIDHRISGKNNYYDNIWNSKIGISPWGLGEKCYRDFEVIYGGGILVKPDTSHVLDWTDTYNLENKYYVPCKTDFSDLDNIVSNIKNNWKKYKGFRKSARDRLIKQCFDSERLANHIAGVFNRCISRSVT